MVGAGCEIGERIAAIGAGKNGRLAVLKLVVAVGVEDAAPAGHAGFLRLPCWNARTNVEVAITVVIVPHVTAEAGRQLAEDRPCIGLRTRSRASGSIADVGTVDRERIRTQV